MVDRPRIVKGVRIAVSAACLVVCALLVALWVSSHYSVFRTHFLARTISIESWKGVLTVNPRIVQTGSQPLFVALAEIPHWWLLLLALTLAGLPWVKWSRRFGLRAFLITATLIAIILGLVAWSMR